METFKAIGIIICSPVHVRGTQTLGAEVYLKSGELPSKEYPVATREPSAALVQQDIWDEYFLYLRVEEFRGNSGNGWYAAVSDVRELDTYRMLAQRKDGKFVSLEDIISCRVNLSETDRAAVMALFPKQYFKEEAWD